MRRAIVALSKVASPCPFAAFGAAIVNHTATIEGELVCIGVNSVGQAGDPTFHGEIAGIRNCTAVLTDPSRPYKLSPSEALEAFQQLSLYTTAESCSQCSSALRWAGVAEYVYATNIARVIELGWSQTEIRSQEMFERIKNVGRPTRIVGGVLSDETDELFGWQYAGGECPRGSGCER